MNSGRHLEANVLGNLTWQKYSIALGTFTGGGACVFEFGFYIKWVLSTMSMMASSIILLSSVQGYKHLGKGSLISYLLFGFSKSLHATPKPGLNLTTS